MTVDRTRNQIIVRRAVSGEVQRKRTKTSRIRRVNLVPEALAALRTQRARSELEGGYVWLTPSSGEPMVRHTSSGEVWRRALKGARVAGADGTRGPVRYRPPNHCRHTYATMLIMAGCKDAYIAADGALGDDALVPLWQVAGRRRGIVPGARQDRGAPWRGKGRRENCLLAMARKISAPISAPFIHRAEKALRDQCFEWSG